MTNGSNGQLFRPYEVTSAVYTIISSLEIEPATTGCRAEILLHSQQCILHTSDATLTSHGNCAHMVIARHWMCLASYIPTLYRGHGHLYRGQSHAGSISGGGDHGIHYWWDLIRSKKLSSVSVCRTQGFARFSCRGNSIHNKPFLLRKVHIIQGVNIFRENVNFKIEI